MNRRPVVLIVPHRDGRPLAAVEELAACAGAITALEQAPIQAVIAGNDPLAAAGETARRIGVAVTALETAEGTDPCNPATVAAMAAFLNTVQPGWVLVADTTFGRHLAPALAARLSAACVTGVEAVAGDKAGIVLTRSVHGGKFRAFVQVETAIAVITVQNGAFAGRFRPFGAGTAVELLRGGAPDQRRRHLETRPGNVADPGLSQARVVVAAGNGIGEADRIGLLQALADRMSAAVVAGSRPVCDRGWLPYSRQVGITGATVTPALYIACGISGAAQHLAGMSGAGLVVAINKDPRAAIFNHADIGVVEDLTTFMPLLVEACGRDGDAEKEETRIES